MKYGILHLVLAARLLGSESHVDPAADESLLQQNFQLQTLAKLSRTTALLEKQMAQRDKIIDELQAKINSLESRQKADEDNIQNLGEGQETGNQAVEELEQRLDEGLRFSGYYDLKYTDFDSSNRLGHDSFDQHHTALFAQLNRGKYSFFAELEWEHSGKGVKQERGWVKYQADRDLSLKGGQFFFPSHWNLNHYPTVSLSVSNPDMVKNLLPWDVTGLMVEYRRRLGSGDLVGNSYLVNGWLNDPANPGLDINDHKAWGQKISWEQDLAGQSHWISLHWYHDRLMRDFQGKLVGNGGDYDLALFEAGFSRGRFGLLSTLMEGRIKGSGLGNGKTRLNSWYLQPSYRLRQDLTFFSRFEKTDADKSVFTARDRKQTVIGFSFKPVYYTNLKLEHVSRDYENNLLPGEKELRTSFSFSF